MPIVKFDVSGTDPKDAFSGGGKQPTPGVYKVKIKELKPGFRKGDNGQPDKTAPRLEVVAEIVNDKKFKGAVLYDYIAFSEASQWKMDQFLQVFGLASNSKRKGSFDTSKVVNKTTKVRVVGDTYNGEYRAKLGSYLMDDEGAGSDEPDDEPEDDGDEQTWAELGEAADNDDEEAIDSLTGLAEEAGLDPNDFETWAELATALEEAEGEEEPEGEDEPEEGESEDDGEEEDLEALGAAADEEDEDAADRLTELANEAGLEADDFGTWAELATALAEAGEEEEPDADDDDVPPYSEWATADLKAELANRGLEATSKKADMVAALEADDEEDPF